MFKWVREILSPSNSRVLTQESPHNLGAPSLDVQMGENLRQLCNKSGALWEGADRYFPRITIKPLIQSGPTCVATCLAMLSGQIPEKFIGKINTQSPVSWSEALMPFGMKLAYCPTDIRKLDFYASELTQKNDLFLLCYYTSDDPRVLLANPRQDGWLCGSHVVVLKGHTIYDPCIGEEVEFRFHCGRDFPTKRIFRVVPSDHARGL